MIFFAVFPTHLLGPSESYVLHPRTLIGDSKRGFPAMIAERSKMIIFDHFKVKSASQVPCNILCRLRDFQLISFKLIYSFRPMFWLNIPYLTNLGGQPTFAKILKRDSLFIVSNAFVKLTNTIYIFWYCSVIFSMSFLRVKIPSVVLLFS